MEKKSLIKSGMVTALHLNELDNVTAGTNSETDSVWFQVESGLQTLSIFTSAKMHSDENMKDAFNKMYSLIHEIKDAVVTAEQEYYKD